MFYVRFYYVLSQHLENTQAQIVIFFIHSEIQLSKFQYFFF